MTHERSPESAQSTAMWHVPTGSFGVVYYDMYIGHWLTRAAAMGPVPLPLVRQQKNLKKAERSFGPLPAFWRFLALALNRTSHIRISPWLAFFRMPRRLLPKLKGCWWLGRTSIRSEYANARRRSSLYLRASSKGCAAFHWCFRWELTRAAEAQLWTKLPSDAPSILP